ncbi:MAG TPA: SRPBCC family protein [Solirubrobacteraceae bacterium]
MKELHGTSSASVNAPPERCIALFEAVGDYPSWHPEVVREVEVLDQHEAGHPSRVQTKLHVARGPLVKDFDLLMSVGSDGKREVKLTKVHTPDSGSEVFEVTWRVLEAGAGTRISLDLVASLDVPRFLPVGGVGDGMAEGFVAAAVKQLSS